MNPRQISIDIVRPTQSTNNRRVVQAYLAGLASQARISALVLCRGDRSHCGRRCVVSRVRPRIRLEDPGDVVEGSIAATTKHSNDRPDSGPVVRGPRATCRSDVAKARSPTQIWTTKRGKATLVFRTLFKGAIGSFLCVAKRRIGDASGTDWPPMRGLTAHSEICETVAVTLRNRRTV